jgi:hypothetical protein
MIHLYYQSHNHFQGNIHIGWRVAARVDSWGYIGVGTHNTNSLTERNRRYLFKSKSIAFNLNRRYLELDILFIINDKGLAKWALSFRNSLISSWVARRTAGF